jgi:NAD(P)-dependent dehydrogenase (short-subunit alcohol dehydrogenase family)
MQVMTAGASIVTVISGAAAGMSGMAVYGATKGAVASLTASWALDLATRGIRVNAVSPLAETRLTEIGRRRLGATDRQPEPERVAPFVSYLLSEASGWITGHSFRVDAAGVSLLGSLTPVAHYAHPSPLDAEVSAMAAHHLLNR